MGGGGNERVGRQVRPGPRQVRRHLAVALELSDDVLAAGVTEPTTHHFVVVLSKKRLAQAPEVEEQGEPALDPLGEAGRTERRGVTHRHDAEPFDEFGPIGRHRPGQIRAPVVADLRDLLVAQRRDDARDVADQVVHFVTRHIARFVADTATARVGNGDTKTGSDQFGHHVTPQRRGIRPTVQEKSRGALTVEIDVQSYVAALDRKGLHRRGRTPTE